MNRLLAAGTGIFAMLLATFSVNAQGQDWQTILDDAKGETVYFHAWGGEPRINAYIQWAAREVERDYGVRVVHVKISDTASVVSQVLAEKSVGKATGGAVDLIWINGENFASMKTMVCLRRPAGRKRSPTGNMWTSKTSRRWSLTSPCRPTGRKAPGEWRSSFSCMTARGWTHRRRPFGS